MTEIKIHGTAAQHLHAHGAARLPRKGHRLRARAGDAGRDRGDSIRSARSRRSPTAISCSSRSMAILRYLDRTFPGPKLWPDDSVGIAMCDQWISAVCDSLVNAALRYMAARFGFLPVPAEMQQKYLDKTREVLPIFDRQLGRTRYLAGDSADGGRPLPGAAVLLLPRHSRTEGDRRRGAQLHSLGARDGGAAERRGHRARAQAAACRLRETTMATIQIYGVPPSPSPARRAWPPARRASSTSWCRPGRARRRRSIRWARSR